MKNLKVLIAFFFILTSCAIEQQEIAYGKDACTYCKMNIVDQSHAAELVTKKGKVYKYDSIECLIRDKENNTEELVALFLVMDYNNPNNFIDAQTSSFLVSEKIPSPMGAYLSAFKTKQKAEKMKSAKADGLFNWKEIQTVVK